MVNYLRALYILTYAVPRAIQFQCSIVTADIYGNV